MSRALTPVVSSRWMERLQGFVHKNRTTVYGFNRDLLWLDNTTERRKRLLQVVQFVSAIIMYLFDMI